VKSISDTHLGDTIILNPSTVLDLRYGITRVHSNFLSTKVANLKAADYGALGVPGSVQGIMPQFGASPDISGGFYSQASWSVYNNKHERQTDQEANGSITHTAGRWTFKAGGEYMVDLSNFTDFQDAAAQYAPVGSATAQYITATGGTTAQDVNNAQFGFAGASILTGSGSWLLPQNFSPAPALAAKYAALYSQNDWHATNKLTVNLGLRWEVQPGPTDRFNRASAIDLTKNNAWGAPGLVVFPGHNGYSRNIWETTWTDFGPNFGLAYQVKKSWVLRGGYGISYTPNNTGWYDGAYIYNMGASSPGAQPLPFGTSPNGTLVGKYWDAAPTLIIPAVGQNSAAPQIYGTGFPFLNYRSERPPRIQQWNFFVEHQLSPTWFVSAGYVGSHGGNLQKARFPLQNYQDVPTNVQDSCRAAYVASNGKDNPCSDLVPNPLQPVSGPLLQFSGTLGQRNIPMIDTQYPYLALLNDSVQGDNGTSDYTALEIHLQHSLATGLLVNANYTWSKALTDSFTELQDEQDFSDTTSGGNGGASGVQDIKNLNNDRMYSYTDAPHRFAGTVVYDLPFGKGRHFSSSRFVARSLLDDWQIGTVIIVESGFPLAPSGANNGSIIGRPNRIASQPLTLPHSLQRWYDGSTQITLPDGRLYTPCAQCFLKYNPDAFQGEILTTPSGKIIANPYWMGNSAINYGTFRGPGQQNVNATLTRDFHPREGLTVSFQANVTNLFNHTQFLAGSYNMGLGGTNTSPTVLNGAPVGTSQSYGTHGLATYDPRQMIMELHLEF